MNKTNRTEWQNTKAGFPRTNMPVLICTSTRRIVTVASWTGDYWCTPYDNTCLAVTHWMPLPEPPTSVEAK